MELVHSASAHATSSLAESLSKGNDVMPECRVLLAEDNPVNQEVGRAMLETLGCSVDIAQNGLEAVSMFTSKEYNMVFMDCQMPRMDGLEATAKIRDAESGKPRRTPVIALTAYVMDDDIELCRTAGMDDYLGKPFSLRDLSMILDRWAGKIDTRNYGPEDSGDVAGLAIAAPMQIAPEPSCLDPRALDNLKAAFGRRAREMTHMVISLYINDSPALLRGLTEAFGTSDSETMYRSIHTLKSSSANLGAFSLAESCRKLENRIKEGSFLDCENIIENIKAQHSLVIRTLQDIIDGGN